MNKHEETSKQTRQNLIDAFWALYCEKRIEKITVREITQNAGYNRGTFYEYFIDVYDVLEQIENGLIPGLNEMPHTTFQGESFGVPFDLFIGLYEKNSRYYSVLLGKKGDPNFTSKLKDSVKPVLLSAVSRPDGISEIEFDFILEYALSAMIGVMSYWFEKDKPLAAEKLVSLMYKLMQNGVTGGTFHLQ